MTELVACLGDDKAAEHVKRVIEEEDWSDIYIISASQKLELTKKVHYIVLPQKKTLSELVQFLKAELRVLKGPEIAVNFFSGKGKEHMALISSLLQLGCGIRFVALTPDGVKEV